MPHPIYYKAGKGGKGKIETCARVVGADKSREVFIDKLRNDDHFRTVKLRWTKHTIEEYVAEYKAKAEERGKDACIKTNDVTMCVDLYSLGELESQTEKTRTVKMENGKTQKFALEDVRRHDPPHA